MLQRNFKNDYVNLNEKESAISSGNNQNYGNSSLIKESGLGGNDIRAKIAGRTQFVGTFNKNYEIKRNENIAGNNNSNNLAIKGKVPTREMVNFII